MSANPSHSTTLNSLGCKETKVSVPMSVKDYRICTPLLQQLAQAQKVDSHVYDETTSTVHVSRSKKVAKEKRFGDVYLEMILEVPMNGDDYETCTIRTGLLRQILFAGLIHSFAYEEETAAAYLYFKTKVEEESLKGKVGNAQAEDLKSVHCTVRN